MKNEKFLNYIHDFPKQFQKGIESAEKISPQRDNFKEAVLCGMGGSSLPGYIIEMLHPKSPVRIHPSYDLPEKSAKDSLIICTSWSGNTEETISGYNAAKKNNFAVVAITKGGKLADLCRKDNTPVALLPNGKINPRNAVGYMYGALAAVLENNGIINDEILNLKNIEEQLSPETVEKRAKELAIKIQDKTPLIYTSYRWRNQAGFWKIFFNENAKIHAFWNSFPGLAHNEIAGFNKKDLSKFYVMFLRDSRDEPRYLESFEKLDGLLEEIGYSHDTIDLNGSMHQKIFNNFMLASLTTAYLAKNLGVDLEDMEIHREV